MKSLYWISFSVDERFEGACAVLASGKDAAVRRAKALGIHPGGEALALRVVPGASRPEQLAKMNANRDRFLSPAECEALFGHLHTSVETRGDILYGADDLSKPS